MIVSKLVVVSEQVRDGDTTSVSQSRVKGMILLVEGGWAVNVEVEDGDLDLRDLDFEFVVFDDVEELEERFWERNLRTYGWSVRI